MWWSPAFGYFPIPLKDVVIGIPRSHIVLTSSMFNEFTKTCKIYHNWAHIPGQRFFEDSRDTLQMGKEYLPSRLATALVLHDYYTQSPCAWNTLGIQCTQRYCTMRGKTFILGLMHTNLYAFLVSQDILMHVTLNQIRHGCETITRHNMTGHMPHHKLVRNSSKVEILALFKGSNRMALSWGLPSSS